MSPNYHFQLSAWIAIAALALACLFQPGLAAAQAQVELADHAFTAAIVNSDQTMMAQWLDPDFTWTDRAGKTQRQHHTGRGDET